MSAINTNGIDVNYPVPGQNNSSQGFRDNFTQIKTNLDVAASEITDIQSKVVVKTALTGQALVNDMGNTLISNAATSGFRATTYNLGNALAGTVRIDVNKADVHYGTVTENVLLQFNNWSPTNTESNVVLRLTIANANASISLPSQCISTNQDFGVTLLENYANVANTATITAPADSSILEYCFNTIDCGNSITVSPINRPFQTTQLVQRDPAPTGLKGDVAGKIAVGNSLSPFSVSETYANDQIVTSSTSSLYVDLPVQFTGPVFGGVSTSNVYYVNNIVDATRFTVSSSVGGGNVDLSAATGTMYVAPVGCVYVCTNSFSSIEYAKDVINTYSSGNVIELSNTTNLAVNSPIIFTGNVDTANTNIVSNSVYYIKTISSPNITVSQSRFGGVAGSTFTPGNKTGSNAVATCYVGTDIWKKINLTSW